MRPEFKGAKVVYLHAGEAIFCKRPLVVSTVLGSCVSITMFNARTKVAAISHCQLPQCKEKHHNCDTCSDPYKYVDCTITKMLEKFESMGVYKEEIEIKLFGGGDVLTPVSPRTKSITVGTQNIISALHSFKKHKVKPSVKEVGGNSGRKMFFLTDNGDVYLSRLKNYEED